MNPAGDVPLSSGMGGYGRNQLGRSSMICSPSCMRTPVSLAFFGGRSDDSGHSQFGKLLVDQMSCR